MSISGVGKMGVEVIYPWRYPCPRKLSDDCAIEIN